MSIIFCGIFKNTIPVFRANSKQFNRFAIRTLFKFLGMSIKSYKTITLRERHLSWSNQTGNKTFSLIEDITIFIGRKNQIFLHITHILYYFLSLIFIINILLQDNIYLLDNPLKQLLLKGDLSYQLFLQLKHKSYHFL